MYSKMILKAGEKDFVINCVKSGRDLILSGAPVGNMPVGNAPSWMT